MQRNRENNRIGKTRDHFKKLRDTKEILYAKMGTIKERNNMDVTEAEDIKERWQEYIEELCKKGLHDPGNSKSGKLSSGHRTGKGQFLFQS